MNPPIPSAQELKRLDDLAFLEQAFISALGRAADPSGLRSYLDHLDDGMPRDAVLSELRESAELRAEQTSLDAPPGEAWSLDQLMQLESKAFVRLAYLGILGRLPDGSGERHYLEKLQDGMPRIKLLRTLQASEEGRKRGSSIRGLGPPPPSYVLREWIRGLSSPLRRRAARLPPPVPTEFPHD
jgi:uncharacterized protein DUF4214